MDDFDGSNFSECPRCGDHSLEHLESFAHCPNCLYSHDLEDVSRPTTLAELEALFEALNRADEREASQEAAEIEFPKVVGW